MFKFTNEISTGDIATICLALLTVLGIFWNKIKYIIVRIRHYISGPRIKIEEFRDSANAYVEIFSLDIENISRKRIFDIRLICSDGKSGDGSEISSYIRNKEALSPGKSHRILEKMIISSGGAEHPSMKENAYNEIWTVEYKIPFLWFFKGKMKIHKQVDLRK